MIDPLSELADEKVPPVNELLDQVRRQPKIDQRDEALDEATSRQDEILKAMDQIRKDMIEAEGYQEAVNLVYRIHKSQQDLYNLTEEERKKRLQEALKEQGLE